jgi:glutamine amidotransferase PdxT
VSGTVTVTASASDNIGVVGVQFLLDGATLGAEDTGAPFAATWDTATSLNGSHTLTAVARDAAGNRTTSAPITVTVANSTADTTPPTVVITTPANGATVAGSVQVTADASDNVAVSGVQFYLDGVSLGAENTAAPYANTWDTNATANGAHALTAVARDAAGNSTTSVAIQVTVSNTQQVQSAPVVTITNPTSGATVSGTVNIAASVSNMSAVGVRFYVDGNPLGLEDNFAPFTVPWDTTQSPAGSHTLTCVARDLAGNVITSPADTVTVSNVSPRRRPHH